MFVLFFWETGLFVLYFCLMNNCSDGSDEVSFFPAGFSNLMEIYRRFIVTKIPKWFLSYSSQRVIFGVLCCALTIFFSSCTMYLKMFFSSIPELPITEVQYSKTGNDIYDFSSDEQQCRFKERFRIHLVAQL